MIPTLGGVSSCHVHTTIPLSFRFFRTTTTRTNKRIWPCQCTVVITSSYVSIYNRNRNYCRQIGRLRAFWHVSCCPTLLRVDRDGTPGEVRHDFQAVDVRGKRKRRNQKRPPPSNQSLGFRFIVAAAAAAAGLSSKQPPSPSQL